jgi:thymidylate synthase
MHLHTRNVNTAFRQFVTLFHQDGSVLREPFGGGEPRREKVPVVKRSSRNGNVMMIDQPVTITYTHPKERVLFNAARDASPFLHLYHALWQLAGRNDVASLTYYASKMKEFSDDGVILNGAYGYRWRKVRTPGEIIATYVDERDGGGITGPGTEVSRVKQRVDVDQLDLLVAHLKADPTSRRAVLQMWNVEDDLLRIGPKHSEIAMGHGIDYSKDVCCNLSVMFSIREIKSERVGFDKGGYKDMIYLDMTVINRSNDLVWGLLGTDYVDFSVLQEYMAARLGVEVGLYHHFTNNLHVYDWNWKPEEWLMAYDREMYDPYQAEDYQRLEGGPDAVYEQWRKMKYSKHIPLVKDPAVFEKYLPGFVDRHKDDGAIDKAWEWPPEPFIKDVAEPMLSAFHLYKRGHKAGAWEHANLIAADDWRLAAKGWIERRANRAVKPGEGG